MLATELTKPPLLPVIAGYFQMKPQIEQIDIKVKILHPRAQLPEYQTEQAAGMDVHAAINQPIFLGPGSRCVINTGLAVEIPPGYEIQIRSRSGLSIKEGIVVVNSPATIDSDYRGEIKVALANLEIAKAGGVTAQTALVQQLKAQQQAVSGVNLDEEAANLLRFQQAYQASSKLIAVAGRLLDSILQIN